MPAPDDDGFSATSPPSSPPAPAVLNGQHSPPISKHSSSSPLTMEELRAELERTQEEKAGLESQYHTLLERLSEMKSKIGLKLKQDAEELERREQLIQSLTTQTDSLQSTIDTLTQELSYSNVENHELNQHRSRALLDEKELERVRIERDEWERNAQEERVQVEELKLTVNEHRKDLELERKARERENDELERERERANNLQSVLQEFQETQERDIRLIKDDYESRMTQVTQSLAEFKSRALNAELELQESTNSTSRVQELESVLKEKSAQVAKLRHEAITLNEHLMEALRRLRRNTTDNSVDRRLITNILLQFITTPRGDVKRFEMLSLLASILSWNDTEREKAGLQRQSSSSSSSNRSISTSKGKQASSTKEEETTESFSKMWVEFLLKESSQGTGAGPGLGPSSPSPSSRSVIGLGSPTTPTFSRHPLQSVDGGDLRSPPFSPSAASSGGFFTSSSSRSASASVTGLGAGTGLGTMKLPSLNRINISSPNLSRPSSRKPSVASSVTSAYTTQP